MKDDKQDKTVTDDVQNNPSNDTANDQNTDDVVIEEDTEIDTEADPDAELQPHDRIKKLRKQLKEALEDKQQYLTGWQREKAEFINIRKRDEESKQDFVKFAEVALVEELIPVLDSCREAMKHTDQPGAEVWIKGIKSMYDKLLSTCHKRGLEEYGEVGDKFDPNIHQSVSSATTDKQELDETIAVVLQKGYRMKGKIIRPALVSIFQV